jgi:hypothetical protein
MSVELRILFFKGLSGLEKIIEKTLSDASSNRSCAVVMDS